jgi:tripartite-type tricarboxylate transporter receptor subunit TctC
MRALLSIAIFVITAAAAQGAVWPDKSIRLVVPFFPGGATDLIARNMADGLGAALGKSIIVDNHPGATGTIALDMVAKAAPDGYTLVTVTDVITLLPLAYRRLSFDPRTSFAPVSLIATQPLVLAVNASLPVRTVKQFFALAKAKPGSLSFGTSGTGTAQHLSGELIKKLAGIDMTHVPYKGGGQAIIDLVGGQIPAAVLGSSTVIPHTRTGRVRILAVTSRQRSGVLADVPTLAESGLADFDVSQWSALLGPAGLPQDIVRRLNAEVAKILAMPSMREKLMSAGFEPAPSSPQQLQAIIEQGMERWDKLIKELQIKIE